MKINIGLSTPEGGGKHTHTVSLDLDILLSTRMLLTADSGGGKTWALKRICEQAFGKIQIIIIDPEGEFSPLREKLAFVLAGKSGETPADIRSASLLAVRLLETRASCICDIFEMKPSQRHEWVKLFIDGLIEAPKTTRHPVLVIVDESHLFCPERGKGESQASEAMISLCTRGRKRLLCPLFATQRLATLNKDASSMLLNRMIGPTFEDLNRKRAAEVLSVTRENQHEFNKQIQLLEPGYFFTLGRALTRERTLVKVGPIKTAHGQEAMKYDLTPPPPPEKVKALLPKLADLPKEAEEKAKTVAEFKSEIRSLKAQLREQPKAAPATDPRALLDMKRQYERQIVTVHADAKKLKEAGSKLAKALNNLAKAATLQFSDKIHLSEIAYWPKEALPKLLPEHHTTTVVMTSIPPMKGTGYAHTAKPGTTKEWAKWAKENTPKHDKIMAEETIANNLGGPHKRILKALAELASIYKTQPPVEMVAAWACYSPNGGAFRNPLGALRTMGLIKYPSGGRVQLTDEGRTHAGVYLPPDQEEINRRVNAILSGPEKKILNVLIDIQGEEIDVNSLADKAGYAPQGGAFRNPLGALRTAGFVEYPRSGFVRAVDWLFL